MAGVRGKASLKNFSMKLDLPLARKSRARETGQGKSVHMAHDRSKEPDMGLCNVLGVTTTDQTLVNCGNCLNILKRRKGAALRLPLS